jgi:hypothetical protein
VTFLNLLYLAVGLVGVNAVLLLLIATLVAVGIARDANRSCHRLRRVRRFPRRHNR